MKHAGPTLPAALLALGGGGVTLFFSEAVWLQMTAAVILLVGIALGVAAIATPEFLEDADGADEGS